MEEIRVMTLAECVTGFPIYRTARIVGDGWSNKESAFDFGQEWVKNYNKESKYGGVAEVVAVTIPEPDGSGLFFPIVHTFYPNN